MDEGFVATLSLQTTKPCVINISNISKIKKSISGLEKGFSKRKFDLGMADQTGGNRNLMWKTEL